jgi:DNA excision repair protein ERCC-2
MIRKMRQARGRLIRSGTDRGVAVVLDNRVTQIPGFDAILSDDLVRDCNLFFDGVMKPSDFMLRDQVARF